jgi:DNA polymerase-3 subunit epsilon
MSHDILRQLFRSTHALPPPVLQALAAWRALPAVPADTPLAQAHLVVVNIETAGFDARRAALRALGAVAIDNAQVSEEFVAPDESPGAGEIPLAALSAWLGLIGKGPVVAFHAAFAQAVLDRVLRDRLGVTLTNPWIDLAPLARALAPRAQLPHPGLDSWLRHFGLRPLVRDHALHDARVTADLFLILLQRATARGAVSLAQLDALARPARRNATEVG